ncbi:MAG TPA: TonB C-terminal domain-containing protein [Candidatus Acidoferrales bacterium]|nr:TonB C-terminal domain-containing protein [Candidatus Acidoferrales bacterium]
MIPRLLVPEKLSPVSAAPPDGRRRAWTILDDRQVVAAELPVRPLEAASNIPSHFPLGVLAERFLVQREAMAGTLEMPAAGHILLPTDADERMAVPVDAHPLQFASDAPLPIEVLQQEDLVTPDVFTTGSVQFLPKQVSESPRDWGWKSPAGSLVFHIVVFSCILAIATVVPHHEPTLAELEAASRNLGIMYLPGSIFNQPKAAPSPSVQSDKLRVDPGLLKKFAPEMMPPPGPITPPQVTTSKPTPELPSAPVPHVSQQPMESSPDRSQPAPRFDAPKPVPDSPTPAFKMPSASPGRSLEDAVRGAGGGNRTSGVTFGQSVPHPGGGGGMSGGGGGGGGFMGGGLQMLTPDQGVDFNGYLARLVARVKQNWYSVMPESARMGDRGRVIVDFKIMRDGSFQMSEPLPRSSSEKPPLDSAAIGALRASSPFEPLPSAFNGPYIELRFIFLYNLPLDYAQ